MKKRKIGIVIIILAACLCFVTAYAENAAAEPEASSYPNSFDLRNVDGKSYITPIRLQNPFGTCWAHGAIAAAESSLIASGLADTSIDLSEKHLIYFYNTSIDDPSSSQNGEGIWFVNLSDRDKETSTYKYTAGTNSDVVAVLSSGMGLVLENTTDPETGESLYEVLGYKGLRGERVYRNVATAYDEEGQPVASSFQNKPVWYSEQDDWSIPEEYRFYQSFRLKDSFILPTPAGMDAEGKYEFNPEGVNAIKRQMYEYHRAVSISYYAESFIPGQDTDPTAKQYISSNWAHFTNDQYPYTTHGVAIVGWDDNYPKENFNTEPEGNGAFLVKNSWGNDFNDYPYNGYRHWGLLEGQDGVPYNKDAKAVSDKATGYFWLSYYDRTITDPETFAFDKATADQNTYIAQTDLVTHKTYLEYYEDGIKTANVFEAETTAELNAISVVTCAADTKVSYAVYLLGESHDGPEDGIKIAEGTETIEYGGFHLIYLNTPTVVPKGQKYSVVIQAASETGDYFSLCPQYMDPAYGYYLVTVVNEDESWLYYKDEWLDYSKEETQDALLERYHVPIKLQLDNFPIKSFLDAVMIEDGSEFEGYLSVNHFYDENPGTFHLEVGESKTLTAEFRGIIGDMPDSWQPVYQWTIYGNDVVELTTNTLDQGKATITGVKPGKADLMVNTGEYGVRIISVIVETAP